MSELFPKRKQFATTVRGAFEALGVSCFDADGFLRPTADVWGDCGPALLALDEEQGWHLFGILIGPAADDMRFHGLSLGDAIGAIGWRI